MKNTADILQKKELIKAVMIGHAVADALGVPVEFVHERVWKQIPSRI